MIWNKKKDGAENPGAETPAAQTAKAPVLFLQKNWKWLVPVVCVVIAGGVFLLKPKSASTTAVDPSYLEASPEVRDVSNTLSGTGTLNPANTYTVKSLVEGKVLTGEFEEGDVLDEGTVLYTLDSSDASTNFEKAEIAMQQAQRSYDKVVDRQYVRAEVDGTVSTLKVAKGDEVTSGQEVAIIRDSSKMLLTLEFPAADAANFSVGQTAQVTLDGTFEQLDDRCDRHGCAEHRQPAHPHRDHCRAERGRPDHRAGGHRLHQRGQLHRFCHLWLSGGAYPDRTGCRYCDLHLCAGGPDRCQERYPDRAERR